MCYESGILRDDDVARVGDDTGFDPATLQVGPEAAVDVVVPEGVTYLSQGAFSGCTGMKNITLPESLKTVGVVCFENCD